MYEYKVEIVKVIDGDTVDVNVDLGFGVWLHKERVRLYGIDTPESRTSDVTEKIYGLAAKEFLIKWTEAGNVTLKTHKYDAKGKFGRILGELWRTTDFADKSLNAYMIEKHHAVQYYGQSKEEIAAKHIDNRRFVIREFLPEKVE